ncbi:hypothetical protein ES708_13561 [subsurface metagenome]
MISKLIRCKLTFKYLRRLNFNSEISVWFERGNIVNKSKEKILIKKERLIVSSLYIIISIFGILFYTFIIVDGFGFLLSIIILIMGLSLRILLLKGKLSSIKKNKDKDMFLIGSILGYILGVLYFLTFIVNPNENAFELILSLAWLGTSVFQTLLYVKFREI